MLKYPPPLGPTQERVLQLLKTKDRWMRVNELLIEYVGWYDAHERIMLRKTLTRLCEKDYVQKKLERGPDRAGRETELTLWRVKEDV